MKKTILLLMLSAFIILLSPTLAPAQVASVNFSTGKGLAVRFSTDIAEPGTTTISKDMSDLQYTLKNDLVTKMFYKTEELYFRIEKKNGKISYKQGVIGNNTSEVEINEENWKKLTQAEKDLIDIAREKLYQATMTAITAKDSIIKEAMKLGIEDSLFTKQKNFTIWIGNIILSQRGK